MLDSVFSATAIGTAQAKHAVSPGIMSWMWADMASSETPLSIQTWSSSLQQEFKVILAA